MAVSREGISKWFDDGVAKGHSHMLVYCDTFDHGDYPVYVDTAQEARERADKKESMQRLMEVYCLTADKELQLSQERAMNFSEATVPKSRHSIAEVGAIAHSLIDQIAKQVRPRGLGVTLLVFEVGVDDASLAYASTAEREDMRATMREMLRKWDWNEYGDGHAPVPLSPSQRAIQLSRAIHEFRAASGDGLSAETEQELAKIFADAVAEVPEDKRSFVAEAIRETKEGLN